MPTEAPVLRVREVSKSFGAVAAVQSVSFDLYGGEAHALVGENGAGKSTIVKMLAGVHRPDAGTLELDGVPIELTTPGRRQGGRDRGDLPGAHALPRSVRRGEHRDGPAATGSFQNHRPRGDDQARPSSSSARLGVAIEPSRPARGSVDRRPAAGRDREGAVRGRPGGGDGRADRRAHRGRGRAVVRGRAVAARRRCRAGLHLAPVRGDHRAVRAGDDHARRQARLHRSGQRGQCRRDGPPDGRPRARTRCSPSRT